MPLDKEVFIVEEIWVVWLKYTVLPCVSEIVTNAGKKPVGMFSVKLLPVIGLGNIFIPGPAWLFMDTIEEYLWFLTYNIQGLVLHLHLNKNNFLKLLH